MAERRTADELGHGGANRARGARAPSDLEGQRTTSDDGDRRSGPRHDDSVGNLDDRRATGLLLDWGGVMTGNLLTSFAAFCESNGLDPTTLARSFREDEASRQMLRAFEEGRVAEHDFERHLATVLGLQTATGLIDQLFADVQLDAAMVAAVGAARQAGIPTGLISNSWGTTRYPRGLLSELFIGVVISGEVGIRKPAPRIYELGAEAIGLAPERCVFVDDLPFNLPPAQALGMQVVHHTSAATTIVALERLLDIRLP